MVVKRGCPQIEFVLLQIYTIYVVRSNKPIHNLEQAGFQTHIIILAKLEPKRCCPKKQAPACGDEQERTIEIDIAIPLPKTRYVAGKDITGDTLSNVIS